MSVFSADRRHIPQKIPVLLDCHIQDIIDIFVLVFDFQSLSVISFAPAYLTRNINIEQKMHLDLDDSVTAARLTASALDIKAEPTFLVSSFPWHLQWQQKIPDLIKHACICRRIERGVRPIGDWSILMTLSNWSSPWISLCLPGMVLARFRSLASCLVQNLIDQ